MTVREYITSKFSGFGITISDADILDISFKISPDERVTEENKDIVLRAIALDVFPQLLLRAKSVSENGFSVSWDNDALMKYYDWLCDHIGIDNTLSRSGIFDKSDIW